MADWPPELIEKARLALSALNRATGWGEDADALQVKAVLDAVATELNLSVIEAHGTELVAFTDAMTKTATWRLTITEAGAVGMEREQLEMIGDAIWLIERALTGAVEGPLTLPRTGLPIRV